MRLIGLLQICKGWPAVNLISFNHFKNFYYYDYGEITYRNMGLLSGNSKLNIKWSSNPLLYHESDLQMKNHLIYIKFSQKIQIEFTYSG